MTDEKNNELPQPQAEDYAHATYKGLIAQVPIVGDAAAELFDLVIAPPLSRRRDEWLNSLYKDFKELEDKVDSFSIEELAKNEDFNSTILQATQIALRTNQKEKLQILRNAVLNAGLPNSPSGDLQSLFIQFIESFTVWHIQYLACLYNPEEWFKKIGKEMSELPPRYTYSMLLGLALPSTIPVYEGDLDLIGAILSDLQTKALIDPGIHEKQAVHKIHNYMSPVTNIGQMLIEFVMSPLE